MIFSDFRKVVEANVEYPANARAIIDAADKYYIPRYSPKPLTPNIKQALINLEEYFEGKADADYEFNDIDGRYIPNEEMGLLNDVQVIKKYFGLG